MDVHEDAFAFTCVYTCTPVHTYMHAYTPLACAYPYIYTVCVHTYLYMLYSIPVYLLPHTCVSAPVSTSQRHVCTHICACVPT